ncbi:molybdopterin-binding protein [uncultured Deefgea sp.]|uniref:TOBE domain-containing protein n=1 Tax=uncultured Deefgea sp. TaxID=1304914 RepID=UPI002594DC1B|nr:TOBE domain-containing protein [uncultured Deefgea sp.]
MNRLPAALAQIDIDGGMAFIAADYLQYRFSAMLLGIQDDVAQWQVGQAVELAFAENDVALAVDLHGQISLRNRFQAQIEHIANSPLLSRVTLRFGEQTLHALITRSSCESLGLHCGQSVEWLVKSNAMQVSRA